MIAIFFVIFVAAAVSMNPPEQTPPVAPEPAPVVIEKTVIIECVPLEPGERLERDLSVPFAQRHYLNPNGDGCRKKSESATVSGQPTTAPADKEQP